MRVQAVRAGGDAAQLDLFLQPGHADLEKLIEIAADDAQVFQPLQQRNGRVFSLRQHSAVEFELAELAVKELLGNELFRQAAAF